MSELDRLDPAVRSNLEALGADFEVLPCEPELADTAVFCEHYGVPLEKSVNRLLGDVGE